MKHSLSTRLLWITLIVILLFCAPAQAATLRIPESTKIIEEEAFYGVASLDEVVIPEGCTFIGNRAFMNCKISKISLPSSLVYISSTAFSGNSGMKVEASYGTYAYEWAVDNGYEMLIGTVNNLKATSQDKKVTLSWETMEGITGYRISEKVSGTNTVLGTVTGKSYYELTGVSTGSHTYLVEAYKTASGKTTYGTAAQKSVTVAKTLVETLSLNAYSIDLNAGKTYTLTASAEPSYADTKTVTWKSDNTKIATVSTAGKITAVSSGTAVVSATAKDGSGVTASCIVNVIVDTPYLTVTHPDKGDVLSAGDIEMHNGVGAYQTWTLNSNYPCRVEKVGDWFSLSATSFAAGQNTLRLTMTSYAPAGTKNTGKVKFYINDSAFVTVNVFQDGGEPESITIDPTISVNHPILGDIFEAGTFEMFNGAAHQTWTITSNCNWTITKSGSWFTIDDNVTSGTAGTKNIVIRMTDGAPAGTTRNGSITFKINGQTYKTVNFKQVGEAKALTVSHATIGDVLAASPYEFHNGSAVQNWTIVSNADWTITKSGTWFTVDKTSGSANTESNPTTNLKITVNSGVSAGDYREGSITFKFGSTTYKKVTFYQDGGQEVIDTNPADSISVVHPFIGSISDAGEVILTNSSDQSQNWTIFSNFNWTIVKSGNWFKVDKTSGSSGQTTLKITTTSYAASGYNKGTIAFYNDDSKVCTITLYQGVNYSATEHDPSLSISHPSWGDIYEHDTIYFHNNRNTDMNWTVMSNVDWTITTSGDWFTVSPKSGSANTASNQSTNVKITTTSYAPTGTTNEGYIRFNYNVNGSTKKKTIYIAQYGGTSSQEEPTYDDEMTVSHPYIGDVLNAGTVEMHNGTPAEMNWTVAANKKWTVSKSGSWFTLNISGANANTESNPTTNLKITITNYAKAGAKNTGTITFYLNGTKYKTVNVFQDGGENADPSMTIGSTVFGDVMNINTVSVPYEKKTYQLKVKANRAWTIEKTGNWFSLSQSSGNADTEYTVSLQVTSLPTGNNANTGTITIKLNGSTYKTINLKIVNTNYVVNEPTDTTLPAPTNVNAVMSGTTSAKLTWTGVTGAAGYNVYRGTSIDGTFTKVNASLVTSPYTDTTLTSGVNYYYYVAAVSSNNAIGSGSIHVGPVSYNEACALNTGVKTVELASESNYQTLTITKHGSNNYTVGIAQYNSAGTLCTGKTTDTDHTLANWLTYMQSGTSLKLTATKNYAATTRTAIVTIKCACGAQHTITVHQKACSETPKSVSMKLEGYNGFTATSTVKGKDTESHLDYVLVPGDTITVAANGGNYARRLTVRIKNGNGTTVLDQSVTNTANTGVSKSYSYEIPKGATGVYTISVFASNSSTAGDDAQWISASATIRVKSTEEDVQLLSKNEFKNRVAEMAVSNYQNSKVLPSIVTAQAVYETGWGQTKIMMKYNAIFAVKATKGWKGGYYSTLTKEYYSEMPTTVTALFRAYDSWQDALDDHTAVLSQSNFAGAIGGTNYKTVAQILQDGVYATDPKYASTIINIIESNKLYEYDKQAGVDSYAITNGSTSSDNDLVKWPTNMKKLSGYDSTNYYQKLLKVLLSGDNRVDTYNIANSQVGYSIGQSNTYNYWIAGSDVSQDWCAAFQSWCVRICLQENGVGNSSILHYTAGASPTMDSNSKPYFGLNTSTYTWKQYVNGTYAYTPQKGDLVFFGNYKNSTYYGKSTSDGFTQRVGSTDTTPCSHVAMVESIKKNSDGTFTMVAIEGNYSGAVTKTTLKYNSNGEQLNPDGTSAYKRAITYFAVPNY